MKEALVAATINAAGTALLISLLVRVRRTADGEDKVSVEGLLCASIGKKGGAKGGDEQGSWEWNESLYEFVWRPDLALLVHGADGLVAQAVPPTDAAWDDEPERVALAYLRRVAASFEASPEKRERIVPLYRPLYDWLEATVRATAEQAAAENVPAEEELQALKDESLVVHRIGYHLEEILLGTTDPLSLLFKDDTVYRVYEKGPTFYRANQILGQALDLDCPLPHNAPLVGFSRVMKNERPGIKSCVVDVYPRFTPAQVAASVFEALASPHVRDEEELVVRQGAAASERPVVHVPRVAAKKSQRGNAFTLLSGTSESSSGNTSITVAVPGT
ncbi:uncharacterized protein ACA1_294700 [Acanthamoeba castellanii str. Neff]|uniref:Uncharacterized protein n=1 Tax=Acanthamoeba castellanii (strain ATCC 30010 / Neff) TaxID=1257118 RepID=L8HLX9_ACACF|nr:uncharacterized protein ACA1_294700 [Acanthamoeba castellanii str. Neff]ELR25426.1 hypothetical protein ACA1_294700 [Acanthamoeba castellanii str. Neff]